MSLFVASSPHQGAPRRTHQIMLWVALAMLPGLIAQLYFFGWGNIIQILIAILTAWAAEAGIAKLRKRDPIALLKDNSALVTAVLLGASIPGMAPWWVIVIGTLFAIAIGKQLYGGLGFNPFNPAMAGYVLLLISFPVEMTAWLPAQTLLAQPLGFVDALMMIFTGYTQSGFDLQQLKTGIDGITMATPLDTVKTDLTLGLTVSESHAKPVFGDFAGIGWEWVNLGFLAGGLFLLKQRIINWHIPVSFLATLTFLSLGAFMLDADINASPQFHLLSGATMLGAFFILTDPVSASTTNKGRLIYGALIALMVFLIRRFGGYPDAVAFAVLIANMAVPLIDFYTQPKTYGHHSQGQ